ncbi:MAG: phosphoribosylaminoimidazolesuccinocarboxamide synthase [Thermodesulfobacteriota bacterium]
MYAVKETNLTGLSLKARGKVRDIYDLGENLLIVATDRISAFDVVMNEPVPDKGKILTQISSYWFEKTRDIVPNHLLSTDPKAFPASCRPHIHLLAGRSMLVRKAAPLPVECVVRGYLAGSGWNDYRKSGRVCGHSMPEGLLESARLAEPIFTPSTKAQRGAHDENITFEDMERLIGRELASRVRGLSLSLYLRGQEIAEARGVIIADTKFEFGIADGDLILIDEILTPDSSRFWPADEYRPGGPQPSFDKQFLRDYLDSLGWDRLPPPPPIPEEVIQKTRKKYLDALVRITGQGLGP